MILLNAPFDSFVALLLRPQHQQELRMLNMLDHVCWHI